MSALILASRSAARIDMLTKAGLTFTSRPADIDEKSIIDAFDGSDPSSLAHTLSFEKARALQEKETYIIGSDQLLIFKDQIISKAKTKEDALSRLRSFSGQTHTLISSVCVMKDGKECFSSTSSAELKMHMLEDDFLNSYASAAGDILTSCVGCYAIEQHGSWLFEEIKGDVFTIMGMPLLPLLQFLKQEGFSPQ